MTPRVALKHLLGFLSIIEMLLKAGANVNHASKWGTPLKEATDDKRPAAAQLLREHGGLMEEPAI